VITIKAQINHARQATITDLGTRLQNDNLVRENANTTQNGQTELQRNLAFHFRTVIQALAFIRLTRRLSRALSGGLKPTVRGYTAIVKEARHNPHANEI
jgi:hypothetical protein